MANPLVALQAQMPNIAGAYLQGQKTQEDMQTARLGNVLQQMKLQAAQDEMAQKNALAQLYQSQGAGLVQGDPNAIGALAKVDPTAALSFQDKAQANKDAQLKRATDQAEFVARGADDVLNAPDEEKAGRYAAILARASQAGMDVSRAPAYGPEALAWLKDKKAAAISVKDQIAQAQTAAQEKEKEREFGITSGETARANKAREAQAAATLAETKRANQAKEKMTEDAALDEATLDTMAEQYLAGDRMVMTNLGRGTQGAANIVKLRGKIAQKAAERGMGGADIAQAMAEFSGLTAGERALGTRTANIGMAVNEAQQIAPLALEASKAVSRSKFVPVTQAMQMVQRGTNDPDLRRFVAANTSLINVYARAINPTGVPTESDKNHAREMLDTAFDQRSYEAVVDQMMKEMSAAQKAPAAVRQEFRYGTEQNRTNSAPSPQPPQNMPDPQAIVDELRKRGVIK